MEQMMIFDAELHGNDDKHCEKTIDKCYTSSKFEIREKTFGMCGLKEPKIIELNKGNLKKIMIGLFSLKELKDIVKEKKEMEASK